MNTPPRRVICYFALAGAILPLVLGVVAFASYSLGMRSLGEALRIAATGSCPSWLLLWAVMGRGDDWIFFAGLVVAVLLLNATLYSLLGLVYSLTAPWRTYWRVALIAVAYPFFIAAGYSAMVGPRQVLEFVHRYVT